MTPVDHLESLHFSEEHKEFLVCTVVNVMGVGGLPSVWTAEFTLISAAYTVHVVSTVALGP
eukprot:COSAG02_NODE_53341_length_302_cov_1.009852_1_plen_60_part_01